MRSNKTKPVMKTGDASFIATYFMTGEKKECKTGLHWEKGYKQRIVSIYNGDLIFDEILFWTEKEFSRSDKGFKAALTKKLAYEFSRVILRKLADELSSKKYISKFEVQRDYWNKLKASITPVSEPKQRYLEEGMIYTIKIEFQYRYEVSIIPRKSRQ